MKTILVPVDFSDVTPLVLKAAGDWASAAGLRVHLLHAIPEETDLVGYETGMQILPPIPVPDPAQGEQPMKACRDELVRRGLEVTTRIVHGSPVAEILDEAVTIGAEVIVMGSHRHGMLHHLLLGSVSGGVLRRATCPVLLVPIPRTDATVPQDAQVASATHS